MKSIGEPTIVGEQVENNEVIFNESWKIENFSWSNNEVVRAKAHNKVSFRWQNCEILSRTTKLFGAPRGG
jgi:hypothetical protein